MYKVGANKGRDSACNISIPLKDLVSETETEDLRMVESLNATELTISMFSEVNLDSHSREVAGIPQDAVYYASCHGDPGLGASHAAHAKGSQTIFILSPS